MTHSWYQVASMSFGYLSAAIIAAIVLFAIKKELSDCALWRRVRRNLPHPGAAGVLSVMSGGKRSARGQEISVPYEGTMGSAYSCDVCLPARRLHMRSAFFWMEGAEMHLVPLHNDGFLADDVPVDPGDEAILRDGAVLCAGDLKLAFHLCGSLCEKPDEPYVTTARRGKAHEGRGEGLGAPGRGEIRREKKLKAQKIEHRTRR